MTQLSSSMKHEVHPLLTVGSKINLLIGHLEHDDRALHAIQPTGIQLRWLFVCDKFLLSLSL